RIVGSTLVLVVVDAHLDAILREFQRNPATNATGASGDDGVFPLERHTSLPSKRRDPIALIRRGILRSASGGASHLRGLAEMPSLVREQHPEAGVEVIGEACIEGGDDARAIEVEAGGGFEPKGELRLEPREIGNDTVPGAGACWHEARDGLEPHASRWLERPGKEPPDEIAAVVTIGIDAPRGCLDHGGVDQG